CHHEFDYANLTKRLERNPPKSTIECPDCLETISVTQLLFGLHYTTQRAVIEELENLKEAVETNSDKTNELKEEITEGFNTQLQHYQELQAFFQRDVLQEIRAVQKQIESPCPTLFAIRPDGRSPYDVRNITSQQFRLQLYCEHPGCLHPVQQGGLYTVDNPQQWLSTIGPHLKRITGIIKYVTPIIGPWVTLADADYAKLIKDDLTLTNDLAKILPSISYTDEDRDFIDSRSSQAPNRQTQRVSGSALRALHEFLKEKDKQKTWGHLSRVKTPEGDILWLCEHHKREFYPTSG
ncbi:MAG: GTPase, partial [Cyanobacteria bacterium J06648_10]